MKRPRKRLICVAGAWGYGPSTTLTMVAAAISRHFELDFVGEAIAFEFISNSNHCFNNVFNADPVTFNYTGYDGMLNVMHAEAALSAGKRGLRIFSVDNLYWFWTWQKKVLRRVANIACSEGQPAEIIAQTKGFSDYHYYSLLYMVSHKVYAPYYGRPYSTIQSLFPNCVKAVQPLVDSRFRMKQQRNILLVSFSGLFNPLVSYEDVALYVAYVKKLVRQATLNEGALAIVYAAADRYRDLFEDLTPVESWGSFDHQSFLGMMNRARLVLAPAGIATTHECAVYGAPLAFLPEQHDGSYANYWTLLSHRSKALDPRSLYSGIFFSEQANGGDHLRLNELYSRIKAETVSEKLSEWAPRIMAKALQETSTEARIYALAKSQFEYLVEAFGGFNGIKQIADDLSLASWL